MKKYIYSWITLLFCLTLFSCEQDDLKDGYGYLSVNVSKNSSTITVTKAGETDDRFLASVYVIKDGTQDTVYRTDDYTAMDPQRLLAGTYRVVVIADSKESTGSNFDTPQYKGETTIQLLANSNQTAKVVCTLANVKASVVFSDKIKNYFVDYTAHVTDDISSVAFVKNETRPAYFEPGTLSVSVDLKNNNGTEFTGINLKTIENTLPRQHYKLNIDIDDSKPGTVTQGGANFTVTVDESTNEVVCNYTIILNNLQRPQINLSSVNWAIGDYAYLKGTMPVAEGIQTSAPVEVTTSYPISRLALECEYFKTLGLNEYIELTQVQATVKTQLESIGIVLPSVIYGQSAATIDLSGFTAKLPSAGTGSRNHLIKVIVRDDHNQETEAHLTLEVQPNGTATTKAANAWAKFAVLEGTCYAETRPSFLFKYRTKGTLAWTSVSTGIDVSEPTTSYYDFTLKLTGLQPATTYEYMACTNTADGGIVEFTTEADAQMPNSSFDAWIKNGKNAYPNADLNENFWWDSGNEGANMLSEKNPTCEETSVVVKGSACKMGSIAVLGNFAAGNVYTGDFGAATISGGAGATLSFGRPFTSRPSKLVGYYKYTPGIVDYAKQGLSKGDTDQCYIYVAVTDWDAPFQVNTAQGTFVDINDASVIGFGSITKQEAVSGNEANGYLRFEIPIDYRTTSVKAKHILVVATASKYGDYFTGSTSSVLYLDELEFVYDEQ